MSLYEQDSRKKKWMEMKVKSVMFIVDAERLESPFVSFFASNPHQSTSPVGSDSKIDPKID